MADKEEWNGIPDEPDSTGPHQLMKKNSPFFVVWGWWSTAGGGNWDAISENGMPICSKHPKQVCDKYEYIGPARLNASE